MNIYDYLKLDHEHVAKLFKQFEKSELLARRKQIVSLICQELLIHAHSEQETFYNALKQFETTKKYALHGQKEHKEIEDLIGILLKSKEFGASWVKHVEQLKDCVNHHVKEEEGTIFTEAQKVLSEEEAYILKEQMHYLKVHLLLSLEHKNKIAKEAKNEAAKKKVSKISPLKKPLAKKHEHRTGGFH